MRIFVLYLQLGHIVIGEHILESIKNFTDSIKVDFSIVIKFIWRGNLLLYIYLIRDYVMIYMKSFLVVGVA